MTMTKGKFIEGVIECSWMSDNNWVIYMHKNRRKTVLKYADWLG